MDDFQWFLVDFFQAFAAGLLVGGIYGLMCVGLGIIFGVMRVVNFAQGDFMMLGMYIAYYLVTGFGTLAFLGPYVGPVVGALLAGPIVFAIGWLMHKFLIARVTGARVVSAIWGLMTMSASEDLNLLERDIEATRERLARDLDRLRRADQDG